MGQSNINVNELFLSNWHIKKEEKDVSWYNNQNFI